MALTNASIKLLSQVLSFPTVSQRHWVTDGPVRRGDLVALSCAPPSVWCLSWVVDLAPEKWLLESVFTGAECWWGNVDLTIYSRERVAEHPEWRWTDRQSAFARRWSRVCFKKNRAYHLLPTGPIFNEDGSVELGTRVRFQFSDYKGREVFSSWKKCTIAMMDTFYKASEAEMEGMNA